MNFVEDGRENALHIHQNISIPEAKDHESLFFEPIVAFCIVLLLRTCCMLATVQLNNYADVKGDEVHNVGAYGELASEFHSCELSRTKPPPKRSLSIR